MNSNMVVSFQLSGTQATGASQTYDLPASANVVELMGHLSDADVAWHYRVSLGGDSIQADPFTLDANSFFVLSDNRARRSGWATPVLATQFNKFNVLAIFAGATSRAKWTLWHNTWNYLMEIGKA